MLKRLLSSGVLLSVLATMLPLTASAETMPEPSSPDTYYVSVEWGNFDGENRPEALTNWDGSLDYTGDMKGVIFASMGFEFADSVIIAESDRTGIDWTSVIKGASDGLLFRLRADMEMEPGFTFNTTHTGELTASLADVLENDSLTLFDDGTYQVVLKQITRDDWFEWLDERAYLNDFSAVLQDILNTGLFAAEESGSYDSGVSSTTRIRSIEDIMMRMAAVEPSVLNTLKLRRLSSELDKVTAHLEEALSDYNAGELSEDAFIEEVYDTLFRAKLHFINFSQDLKHRVADADKNAWYWEYLEHVSDLRYFEGYENLEGQFNGQFRPGANATWAEVIKVAYNLSVSVDMGAGTYDCDPETVETSSTHWLAPYIACIEASGTEISVLDLIGDDLSKASNLASRAVTITTVFEMLGVPAPEYDGTYDYDDLEDVEGYMADFIQLATDLDIVDGYGNREFRPRANINRAELFKIFALFDQVYSTSQ